MGLNPFKKDPVKKEKTTYYKKIKEEIENEIRKIEKLSDPAARVVRYKATLADLAEFYDSGKLGTSNRLGVLAGGTAGTVGGLVTGSAAGIVTVIAGIILLAYPFQSGNQVRTVISDAIRASR